MRSLLLILSLQLALGGLASAEDLKPSKYPKVYKGEEGIRVTVIPMMPKTAKKALVQVTGRDTEIDGLVIMHDVKDQGKGNVAYETTLHGEGFWTLYSQKSWGWKQYKLQLPETPMEKIYAYYDETESKKVNTAVLMDKHKSQTKQIAKLQKWNRKEREARHNKKLKEVVDSVNEDCGSKIKSAINWKSVTNDHLKGYSIYSFCGYPLESIGSLCRNEPAVKAKIKKEINAVACQFGKKMKLDRKKTNVMWTTNPDEANQGDFTKAYFKNELQ